MEKTKNIQNEIQAKPGYQEVKNNYTYWKPTKGDEIEGKLLRKFKSNFGESFVLDLGSDILVVLPGHTVLSGLLSRVVIGEEVHIICLGESEEHKKGQKPSMLYKVFVKQ